MSAYPEPFLGLAISRFWHSMEQALADALKDAPPPPDSARLDVAKAPTIELAVDTVREQE